MWRGVEEAHSDGEPALVQRVLKLGSIHTQGCALGSTRGAGRRGRE